MADVKRRKIPIEIDLTLASPEGFQSPEIDPLGPAGFAAAGSTCLCGSKSGAGTNGCKCASEAGAGAAKFAETLE
jgi:hypothetical protein